MLRYKHQKEIDPMARKSAEQIKEASKETRFRMHQLITSGESEGDALGLVFDWNRNRGRSFTTWRRHGLWPIPDDEQDELRAFIERDREADVEQPEHDEPVPDSNMLLSGSTAEHEPPVGDEEPAEPVTDLVSIQLAHESYGTSGLVVESTENDAEQGSSAVAHDSTARPEEAGVPELGPSEVTSIPVADDSTAISHDLGMVPEDHAALLMELIDSYSTPEGDLFRMIQEWKVKTVQSTTFPERRPIFRSDFDHQITGVRIKSFIWEAAKQKMLTEKVKTGGSMSALIELLLWEYAGRLAEALEGDATPLEDRWFSKKGGAGN